MWNKHLSLLLVRCKIVQVTWEEVWQFLAKLNILLPYDPKVIPTIFGIYPKELKTYIHLKTCTPMFTAALFIIAKFGSNQDGPSVVEWVIKPWHIQTMEYHSVPRRKELWSHEKTGKNRKCILQSERSQSEKTTYCMIPARLYSGKGKTMELVKRSGLGIGERNENRKHRGFLGQWKCMMP